MTGYRRITEHDRENILIYLSTGNKQSDIASKLGVTQPTISRELKKGLQKGMYNPFLAQRNTNTRLLSKKPELKINKQTWTIIENHLSRSILFRHPGPAYSARVFHDTRRWPNRQAEAT